jgi:hypothetical protein
LLLTTQKKAIEERNKALNKEMSDGAQLARERKAWEQGNRDLLRQEREEQKRIAAQRKIDVPKLCAMTRLRKNH